MAVEIKTDLINVEGGISENYDKVIECSNGLLNVCDHMRSYEMGICYKGWRKDYTIQI